MKAKRDVKFIIYQSLYIFIICVIAMKGADINLDAVELKKMIDPGYVYIDTTGKVLIDRDRVNRLIEFDSTRFIVISRDEYNKNPEKFAGAIITNPGNFGSVREPLPPPVTENPQVTENPTVDIKKDEITIGNLELFQYHQNTVPNQGNNPITLAGTTIPAHSTGRVTLGGESVVTIASGSLAKNVTVKENKKPQINFQRVSSMGEEARVSNLQRNIGFRVTIIDDFPEQLDVKFNGPVSVKQVSANTYDVTLSAFANKSSFDFFTDNKQAPYNMGFTVTVTDKLAPHKITGQQTFIFGEW